VRVIADNCTDDTAAVAEAYGDKLMVRRDEEESNELALFDALERIGLLESKTRVPHGARVVFDTDTLINRGFPKAMITVCPKAKPEIGHPSKVKIPPIPDLALPTESCFDITIDSICLLVGISGVMRCSSAPGNPFQPRFYRTLAGKGQAQLKASKVRSKAPWLDIALPTAMKPTSTMKKR